MKLEELFESYLSGKMPPTDRELFEKLLAEDLKAQTQFEAFKLQTKDPLSTNSGPIPLIPPTKRSPVFSWLIAAGIALIIVVGGFFLFQTLSMAPGEKLFLAYYEPMETGSLNQGGENPMLAKALSAFENQEYEQAAVFLEELVLTEKSPTALLFLGLCHLELDRPEKAIPTFNRIPAESDFYQEGVWYEAMGFLKLNKLPEAKKLLEISASNPNPHTEKAKEILQKIK